MKIVTKNIFLITDLEISSKNKLLVTKISDFSLINDNFYFNKIKIY